MGWLLWPIVSTNASAATDFFSAVLRFMEGCRRARLQGSSEAQTGRQSEEVTRRQARDFATPQACWYHLPYTGEMQTRHSRRRACGT